MSFFTRGRMKERNRFYRQFVPASVANHYDSHGSGSLCDIVQNKYSYAYMKILKVL
jgi:hypothetical protein